MGSFASRLVAASFSITTLLLAASANAGIIADENAKPGNADWSNGDDGTARFDGVVDLYPANWSITPGEALKLKVRSTTGYGVKVYRLGYYGGAGARLVSEKTGLAAQLQPYPTPDAKYGMAEARWATSVEIDSAGWVPGLYVARADQTGGKMALTFFVVKDDALAAKLPYVLVIGTATHQTYNAWPGPAGKGATPGVEPPQDPKWVGKSLYGFNSSPVHPTDSIGDLKQAVRVSFDRPYFVGRGTADLTVYEYPFLRWAEKMGYDFAYATDVDMHVNPNLLSGRKLAVVSGHEEYVSWQMFDNAINARKSGVNFLFLSGDTWSWQVRFEPGAGGGTSTLIGYKESWARDPEQKTAYSLKLAGQIEDAKSHYRLVTRGWKNLEFDAANGIDERRPGMTLTGVQSSGIIRDAAGNGMHGGLYPWADFVVQSKDHWIFDGTGLANGGVIGNIFGYEVDSTMKSSPEFDKFRKPGQIVLGAIKQVSDGTIKGAAAWYRDQSTGAAGAEVVAMSAIYTSWGLDDFGWKSGGFQAAGKPNPLSVPYQRMIKNVIDRFSGGVAPEFDAGALLDAGEFDVGPLADAEEIEKDVGATADVETVDVSMVGGADTSVAQDTQAPAVDDTGTAPATDAPPGADVAPGEDALPGTDATPGDATVADGAVDAGAVNDLEGQGSDCSCTTPGRPANLTGLGAIALAGLVIARRSRKSRHARG